MRDFGEFTARTPGTARRRRRSGAIGVGAALAVCAALVFVVFAHPGLPEYGSELAGTFGREDKGSGDASAQTADGPEPVNILLMGLDGRGDAGDGGTVRTDTLMLARLDPDTGEVSLLSIPRDLLVKDARPGGGRGRINSAYAYGGADRAVETVEDFTGLPVDHYVAADFSGFKDVVNALGGVEVDVEGDYLADRGIPSGEQVLDGKEALFYARYRKTPRGDLGRIERQQELLAELRSQMLGWESIGSIPGVIRALNESVETDMGVRQMASLGRALAAGSGDSLEAARLEGDPVTLDDGREVLVPDEERNERILYEFLR